MPKSFVNNGIRRNIVFRFQGLYLLFRSSTRLPSTSPLPYYYARQQITLTYLKPRPPPPPTT
jgi:hypothetical protein